MDEEFEALVQEFFYRAVEREPIMATWLGLHEYDHLLPDRNEKAVRENVQLLKEYRKKFEAVSPERPENVIDREAALYIIDNTLFEYERLSTWAKYPSGPMEFGDSIFLLLSRETRPLSERLKAIKGRLERAREFFEGFKTSLRRPVKVYVEIGLEQARTLPSLIEMVRRMFRAKGEDIGPLSDEVKAVIKEHQEWMERELLQSAEEEFAIGEEMFGELLKVRGFEMDVNEVLEIGLKGIKEEKAGLRELARALGEDDYRAALKKVKSKHPKSYEEVKKYVEGLLEEARALIEEKGFATLPEGEELVVRETPEYLRPIMPFAAYMPPGPFEEKLLGIYLITPMEGEMLQEACYACLANTLVHEGYPGHHLQLSCASKNRRPIRFLSQAPETVEGWALYCEEAMKELGFHADAEGRLVQRVDSLWRAVRVVVDVNLSTGRMGLEEAAGFLSDETGMAMKAALSEVKSYSLRPGYFMSYYLGKKLIKELKEEARRAWRDEYSDRRFHDLLLYEGSLPLHIFKKLISEE